MLRLATMRDGAVVPYADDADRRRAWSLSEVSVAADRVAACPVPPALAAAAEAAQAQWGRWERESPAILLALMTPEGGRYNLPMQTGRGKAAKVAYDPRLGLLLDSA